MLTAAAASGGASSAAPLSAPSPSSTAPKVRVALLQIHPTSSMERSGAASTLLRLTSCLTPPTSTVVRPPSTSKPTPLTSTGSVFSKPGHTIRVTVISFCVRVPVLSTQITVAQPSASTAGSFLTIALRAAIRITPSARVTVTQMGKPSGMAATARETPIWNMSSSFLPWITPMSAITPMMPKLSSESFCPSSSIETCSGVFRCSTFFISWKVLPKSVFIPVAMTTARPWP
mmetsp:Transcript_19988/g.46221  ORF Transcript_19988/g.46221 Transcript_19988/m.46221 type:complete len:231 (-) Transcript_19988:678-1370(-)